MKTPELISVIIPVYNVEQYLNRCVDSVINQTYKNLEIILVDDGSTDNSGKICDEYALKDNRIKVIHKENGGLSSARNAGLDIAKGAYIGFIDSDDYIELDMYEFLYNMLIENKVEVSCCNVFDFKNNKYVPSSNLQVEGVITFDEVLNIKQGLFVWNKLYSKNLIGNYRFDGLAEDLKFNFEILKKAEKIVYSKQAKCYYFNNPNSILRKNNLGKYLSVVEFIKLYDKTIEYCKEKKLKQAINNIKNKQFYWIINMLLMVAKEYQTYIHVYKQKESLKFLLQHIKKDIRYWLFGNYNIKTKCFLLLSCINFNLASKICRLILKLKNTDKNVKKNNRIH